MAKKYERFIKTYSSEKILQTSEPSPAASDPPGGFSGGNPASDCHGARTPPPDQIAPRDLLRCPSPRVEHSIDPLLADRARL